MLELTKTKMPSGSVHRVSKPMLGFTDPVVLGLDQSYTGFGATLMSTEDPTVFQTYKFEAAGSGPKRLTTIRDEFLREFTSNITDVVMEGYAPGAKFGREIAGELGGLVKVWCWDKFGYAPWRVAPMSLKKYITGKGSGNKNVILMAVYKKWGIEFPDDNMADSYGLAHMVAGHGTLAYEREVWETVRNNPNSKEC